MWVQRGRTSAMDPLVGQGSDADSSGQELLLGYTADNNFVFKFTYCQTDNPAERRQDCLSGKFADSPIESLEVPGFGADNGNWIHWSATFDDETKEQNLFRNGAIIGSRTATSSLSSIGPILIGTDALNKYTLLAAVDETRFFNKRLSTTAVADNFHKAITLTSGLVCALTFDSAGDLGADSSGNGNRAQPDPSVRKVTSMSRFKSVTIGTTAGKGKAGGPLDSGKVGSLQFQTDAAELHFNGTQVMPLDSKGNSGPFSVQFWVKRQRQGVSETIMSVGKGAIGEGVSIGYRAVSHAQGDAFAFEFVNDDLVMGMTVDNSDPVFSNVTKGFQDIDSFVHWSLTMTPASRSRRPTATVPSGTRGCLCLCAWPAEPSGLVAPRIRAGRDSKASWTNCACGSLRSRASSLPARTTAR
jgi:hypothetical protein